MEAAPLIQEGHVAAGATVAAGLVVDRLLNLDAVTQALKSVCQRPARWLHRVIKCCRPWDAPDSLLLKLGKKVQFQLVENPPGMPPWHHDGRHHHRFPGNPCYQVILAYKKHAG